MKLINKIIKWSIRQYEKVVILLRSDEKANLFQTSSESWVPYFEAAEKSINKEWDNIIWPLIKDFNFDVVLELSPGAGRNTEKLCQVSKKIYAVDYMPEAIEQCRKRLGNSFNGCEITYHLNNGRDLIFLNNQSISMVYCWDSAVHFNRTVLESYVKEFARVLKPGGKGFVHHSNLGNKASKNIKNNPLWRSNVSKQFFAEICSINGLKVEYQIDIPWGPIMDSATVFSRPTL